MRVRKRQLRPLLLIITGVIIVTKVVALSPSTLEESKSAASPIDPETLVLDHEPTLIPGLPQNRIAEYSIQKFTYVSVQNGEKQWRIEAASAFLYNPERLVHARGVKAYLYDPEGKITVVTGLEAKYFLNQKDLEVFGNVKTVFPDGFELYSEYLQYKPKESRIFIPKQYLAHGVGQENIGQSFQFNSHGLDYYMGQSQITLQEDVTVKLARNSPQTPESTETPKNEKAPGVPDVTTIESDHCLINRKNNLAKFTMNPNRPLKTRFVHITQPSLFVKARRADLNYGNFSQVLQYLTAYDDVLVKEKGSETSLRYATGGRADFDTHRDVIVISQFPQVYQGEDTVTGDLILMHRDTDVIEIEHSNAFSEGSE